MKVQHLFSLCQNDSASVLQTIVSTVGTFLHAVFVRCCAAQISSSGKVNEILMGQQQCPDALHNMSLIPLVSAQGFDSKELIEHPLHQIEFTDREVNM